MEKLTNHFYCVSIDSTDGSFGADDVFDTLNDAYEYCNSVIVDSTTLVFTIYEYFIDDMTLESMDYSITSFFDFMDEFKHDIIDSFVKKFD